MKNMEDEDNKSKKRGITVKDIDIYKNELIGIREKISFLQVNVFDDNQNLCIDRFHLLGLIGMGAYSKVYRAMEKKSKGIYSVKIIRKILTLHRRCISHLKREIQIMRSFRFE